ncbi:MAG: hypothetical protein QME32_02320 [Endomicrobiia bacterium]|nr:hypothetical protein [Endomicrobiia bacterium]
MKKAAAMLFPLIASFALAGIVFYYLIVIPMSGGYNVTVRTAGLSAVYAPGAVVAFDGIISNNGKNASEFYVTSTIDVNGAARKEHKKYFLAGGQNRHFSFEIPTDQTFEGKKSFALCVSRPSKLPGFKDVVIWSSKSEIMFARPAPPSASAIVAAKSARAAGLATVAAPPKYVEEIVRARFAAMFPEALRYNKVAKISARLTNITSTRETFEILLEIKPPSGEKTAASNHITIEPAETKQVDFLYNVPPSRVEGEYSAALWYRTRQAVSEETYKGVFVLSDEDPALRIKKMLMNPVSGRPSEILVEASDDIGVNEVIFMAAAQRSSGGRSEYRNIPMHLISGTERSGVWRCEYIPEKSDAYVFSFVAFDTKRRRARLGEFPVKVIK